jgi:hypothetical protein
MFIMRKLLKTILLPVSLLLFLIKWTIELTVRITSAPIGLLLIFVTAGMVYCLVCSRWTELLIFIIIGVLTFAALFFSAVVMVIVDEVRAKIRDL